MIPLGVLQQPEVPFAPTDIASLRLWLDASDRGVTANRWDDKSGYNNHFNSSDPSFFPTFSGGEAVFDGTNDHLDGPSFSSFTAGEIFLRVSHDDWTNSSDGGLQRFGTSTSFDHYTYNSVIYDGFGSTVRKTCGGPVISIDAIYRTVNIWSASGDYAFKIDGNAQYSTGSNTVAFRTTPEIGNTGGGHYFDGRIKAVCLFNAKLSSGDRALMETYMAGL